MSYTPKEWNCGDTIKASDLNHIEQGIEVAQNGMLSDEAKEWLINCFEHVAWVDEHGREYVDGLIRTIIGVTSLRAEFNQTADVFPSDSLDVLKSMLTVTASYGTIADVEVEDYTLSGNLTSGTSVITVTYEGKSTTFEVIVSEAELKYSVQNSDFMRDIGVTYITPPYYATGFPGRMGYVGFDLPIEGGKKYKFDIDSNYDTAKVSISYFNQNALDKVALNQACATSDFAYGSWMPSGGTMEFPAMMNGSPVKGIRIWVVQELDGSTAMPFSDDFYANVSVSEVVRPKRTWLYHFNGNILPSGNADFGLMSDAEVDYIEGHNGDDFGYLRKASDENAVYGLKAVNIQKYSMPNGNGDLTISFWGKAIAESTTGIHGFEFAKAVANSGYLPSGAITSATSAKDGWTVNISTVPKTYAGLTSIISKTNSTVGWYFANSDYSKGSKVNVLAPSGFDTKEWHHYAMTKSGKNIKLFVDGELVCTAVLASEDLYIPNKIAVGTIFKQTTTTDTELWSDFTYDEAVQDLYITEECKWTSDFDPNTIVY